MACSSDIARPSAQAASNAASSSWAHVSATIRVWKIRSSGCQGVSAASRTKSVAPNKRVTRSGSLDRRCSLNCNLRARFHRPFHRPTPSSYPVPIDCVAGLSPGRKSCNSAAHSPTCVVLCRCLTSRLLSPLVWQTPLPWLLGADQKTQSIPAAQE